MGEESAKGDNTLLQQGSPRPIAAFSLLAGSSRVALHYHIILPPFSSLGAIDSAASLNTGLKMRGVELEEECFSCFSLHALLPTRFAGSNEFECRCPEIRETGTRQPSQTSATGPTARMLRW